jgi:hypothetical protein
VRDAAKDDYRFVSIVLGVVNSPAFQMQMTPEGTGEAPPVKQAHLRASEPPVPLASAQGARNDANLRAFNPPLPLASAERASEPDSRARKLEP